MGTNFYALPDVCECCDRPAAEIHIGKSGSMLRGYRSTFADELQIETWQQWKDFLRADPKMQVRDENGRTMSVDELIDYFESTSMEQRRRQYDWVVEHRRDYDYMVLNDELEPDGFSICFREFF